MISSGCAPTDDSAVGTATNPLGSGDRYIVKFKDWQIGMGALKAAGAEVVLELTQSNAAAAKIPAAALNGLKHNPNIEYIEVDAERKLVAAQQVPYGIDYVQAPLVPYSCDPATGCGLRKVCIIDTGYNLGHEDLPTANVTSAYHPCDPSERKCRHTGDPMSDGHGHGSHVAGTIAALDNAVGVVGVMPNNNVALHIIKIFNESGSWVSRVSNLIRALEQCREAGANVVSMSLGGGAPSTTERDAFAAAYAAGVLPIAAASNDSNSSYSYPASYDAVMSVAAIDQNKAHAYFSNWNDKVEIAAPGVGVLSTIPGGYAAWNGTSMATPHVSAAAALVWSHHPTKTAAEIRAALTKSAEDLGPTGRDVEFGFGLVQAQAAVQCLADGTCPPDAAPPPPPPPPVCSPSPEVCTDGIDNDCDGLIDGADGDCGPVCRISGKCKKDSECCSQVCAKASPGDRFGACVAP